MAAILTGCLAFCLFIVYEYNNTYWHRTSMRPLFSIACILLVLATVKLAFFTPPAFALPLWARTVCGIGGAVSGLLLIYSLFFALPFQETYIGQPNENELYDRGVYALCRHPGVLWFILFYFFLWLFSGVSGMLAAWLLFSLFNLAYIWLQDYKLFPLQFPGYGDYRKTTPFLIPTASSVRRCAATLPRKKHLKKGGSI